MFPRAAHVSYLYRARNPEMTDIVCGRMAFFSSLPLRSGSRLAQPKNFCSDGFDLCSKILQAPP